MQPADTPSNLLGIGLILIAVAVLSTMDATVKYILEGGLSVLQMVAMRSWLVVPLLLLWMVVKGGPGFGFSMLATKKKGFHFLRAFFGFGAPFFFFSSLKTLSLPDATVIFFSSTFIMTALSVPILKERVGVHRWGSVIAGFLGIVIAVNPGGEFFSVGVLYSLSAAFSYSLMMIITRKIGSHEGTFKLLFYFHAWMGLVSTVVVLAGIGGLEYRVTALAPELRAWGGIGILTVLAITGHYCMMRAFSIAPVGLVAPFDYLAILWSTFFGYLIWDHVPGVNFWVGSTLVVSSGIYLVYRETRAGRGRRAGQVVEVQAGPAAVPVPPSIATLPD